MSEPASEPQPLPGFDPPKRERMPYPRIFPHDTTENLLQRQRRGGQAGCLRCGKPQETVDGIPTYHVTMYEPQRGMLPLCKGCYGELVPESRLPYYLSLLSVWGADFALTEKVIQAVREGK